MLCTLADILRRIPVKTMLVVVFLCFVDLKNPPLSIKMGFAEFYPLSCFPMFSTFSPYANYVYITDAKDEPLALSPTFHMTCGALTKSYRRFIKDLRAGIGGKIGDLSPAQKRPAGEALLRRLRDDIAPSAFADGALPHLKLYEVILSRKESGEIVRDTYLVGELKENPDA